MTKIKLYIYIILVLFIVANIMQKLIMTRKYIDTNLITARVLFMKNMQNCYVKTRNWSFFIPNCDQYREGEFLEVSGSRSGDSDKGFFQLKRLKVQAVKRIFLNRFSVKHWWNRALVFIYQQKDVFLERGLFYLPPTHASLVAGMVFGGTDFLPQELQQAFQATGLTHVVSASGYNVSVVAGMVLFLLSKILSKRFSSLATIFFIWSYAIAAELVAPIIRSSIMISLNLIASRVFFRQYNLLFSLLFTVLVMLLWEPFYAQSLSFWLSTLATLGIILVLPLLEGEESWFSRLSTGHFSDQKVSTTSNVFQESFLVTLAAQSLTLPLVITVFGEFSVLSFLTNTVLLWLTPLITISGLGLMMVGFLLSPWPGLWQFLAPTLGLVVWLPTELFISSVGWFGQFKWGLVKFSLPWWAVGMWWGMLGIIVLRKKCYAH
jgi:ComEC/Rec2-related protein